MDKGKPVGIWIRVSTEDQTKGERPEHHEKRARYYAESKDAKFIKTSAIMRKNGLMHISVQSGQIHRNTQSYQKFPKR